MLRERKKKQIIGYKEKSQKRVMQDADMQRNIQHNEFGSSVNPNFLIGQVDFARTALKV